MNSQTKSCQNCKSSFIIEPDDFSFYAQMHVPPPTWCPECRMKRRNVWRVERKLYHRQCDLCKEKFIFVYPEGTPFPVYCRDCWLSDRWDPKAYARGYDFSKPFFEQWRKLFNAVPRVGIIKQGQSVNSEYTNRVTDMRNCYLVYATTGAEDSRYSAFINGSKDCLDCYDVFNSEQCSECIDCYKCYNVHVAQESQECRDSMFLFQCRDCSDCFGCVNLRSKRYCIFNQQYSREDYFAELPNAKTQISKFEKLKATSLVPNMVTSRSSNSSGNWIENAKRAVRCFNVRNVEDMRYCQNVFDAKDCMDYSQWGNGSEMIYESVNCGIQCARLKFVNESWSQLMDSEYCTNCHQSSYLFGCNGIRGGQYLILNQQYTKENYEMLVEKIKTQMTKDGEYGEFFPEEFSPFAYNETTAQELFPLTKEEALREHHRWRDQEINAYEIKDDVVACEHSGECVQLCTGAFRILPADQEFYQRHHLSQPKLCPNCRHFERLAKRNPLKLWERTCAKCTKAIETSYATERPEIVYCVECYTRDII